MPVFEYQGLDRAGKTVKGVRDADNERALRSMLKRDGLFLTRVSQGADDEGGGGGEGLSKEIDVAKYFERIKAMDVALFTRQLATLVRAGVPLVKALGATVDQIEKPKLRKIIAQIRQDVSEGASLAAAVAQHPEAFGAIFSSMIRAGEASGTLDQVLLRLAEFTEAQVKLKQKVTGAMTYPVLMLGLGGLILTGMFIFVIPQITQIFADTGQELPLITRLLIGTSHAFSDFWYLGFGSLGLSVWGFRRWVGTEQGRARWDRGKLKIPVFGSLMLMISLGRFTKTLATLMRAGVPLLTALDITRDVMANVMLSGAIEAARVAVREGANLADPLKAAGHFPPIMTHMIAIGEQSGELEEMLTVVADAYETQVEARISTLTTLLEPMMIVIMGITIAIVVFAVLLPILQLNEFVQ